MIVPLAITALTFGALALSRKPKSVSDDLLGNRVRVGDRFTTSALPGEPLKAMRILTGNDGAKTIYGKHETTQEIIPIPAWTVDKILA
jgi:hypothetical protein